MIQQLKYDVIQDAATANANGATLDVSEQADHSFDVVVFQITGTFTATVHFEGTVDDSNWVAFPCVSLSAGTIATSATATGIYRGYVTGLSKIRARVAWSSGTSVTVTAQLVQGSAASLYNTIAAITAGNNNIGDVDVVTLPDVRSSWRFSTLSFTTTNDSDTTFTVGADTEYQILSISVAYTSSGDAGDRQLAVLMTDSSDVTIGELVAGVTQAASLTYRYQWGPGLPQETVVRDGTYIAQAMFPIFLTAGQKLRVFDNNAVAATADDMVVKIQIASRSIA